MARVDEQNVFFNLEEEMDLETADPLSLVDRYIACVNTIRDLCGEVYHGALRTNRDNELRFFNLVVTYYKYAVSLKVRISDCYVVAYRCGRGNPNGPNNDKPWFELRGHDPVVAGATLAYFFDSYDGMGGLEVNNGLGVITLGQAVTAVANGNDSNKHLKTIIYHVIEGVRLIPVFESVCYSLTNYISMPLSVDNMVLIKNWQKLSKAVQNHFDSGNAFQLTGELAVKFKTLQQVTQVLALLHYA